MLFSSTVFLVFFLPALLVCYYLIPLNSYRAKNGVLFIFSIIFYAWGGIRYLLLLVCSMVLNYLAGRLIGWSRTQGQRRAALIAAVAVNLGLLGYYKYTGFAVSCLQALGLELPAVEIVLPIGISFFTFQGMSYVIDVYREDAKVQRNVLDLCLYIALFPQLVAGPIVRYTTVERELSCREHSLKLASEGLVRFLFGLGKKMLIANTMGQIADKVFGTDAAGLGGALAWMGAIAYTFQIYFDFSAYSDMAIGLGKLFGFRFLENFNYPYIASSVTEFWRRWHISLSSWFRDYVYIPLGGNRCGRGRQIVNLLITWFLTGMWHGANWTFIAWGMYYGGLLIVEKFLLGSRLQKLPGWLRHCYTMVLVIFGWVLFRAPDMTYAWDFLKTMLTGFNSNGMDLVRFYLVQYRAEWVFALIGVFPVKKWLESFLEQHRHNALCDMAAVWGPKILAMGVFGLSYLRLISGSFNPFIYFQF